jgi:hypothetical protein
LHTSERGDVGRYLRTVEKHDVRTGPEMEVDVGLEHVRRCIGAR